MNNYVYNEFELGCGDMAYEYTNKPFGYGRCCGCKKPDYYIVKGVVEVEKLNGGCPCRCNRQNFAPVCPNSHCGCNKQNNAGIINAICLLKLFM